MLSKKITKAPPVPGIYIFRNSGGKELYIGKASNLKSRLGSYLRTEDARIKKMVSLSKNLDFTPTNSDIEALILESQYIKKHRPMFNVVMRDDKQYFYVEMTKEKFPRLFLTHQPSYTTPTAGRPSILKTDYIGPFTDGGALKATLRYLRNIFPYCTCKQKHNNYCLNYHISKCLGFCCLKKPEITSKDTVSYRKNTNAIKAILSGKKVSLIKKLEKEMVSLAKKEDFEEAIKTRTKLERLQRIFENARIIKDLKKTESVLTGLKEVLSLENIPYRIEAYDISNIQGQNATGSMAVFENGRTNKNEYRKFKIKTLMQADDTGMLKEVLTRRFNHPEWAYPDLIIIDGGKGQLSAANSVISKFNISTIALTKNLNHKGGKITLTGKSINLDVLPENIKNLILAVDAEAHRFAITYYRKLHRKGML